MYYWIQIKKDVMQFHIPPPGWLTVGRAPVSWAGSHGFELEESAAFVMTSANG